MNGFAPGIKIGAKMRPRSRPVRACPGIGAPDGRPTIDAMPLQIHTQPDPDHFCETCGGPSELISQTITPWDGNETMARELSPWTPRCADPWCQSRKPRHSKMSDTRVCEHCAGRSVPLTGCRSRAGVEPVVAGQLDGAGDPAHFCCQLSFAHVTEPHPRAAETRLFRPGVRATGRW